MLGFDNDAYEKELKECLRWAIEMTELNHYKCDINSDTICYAEQYGDGDETQHRLLRKAHKLLKDY